MFSKKPTVKEQVKKSDRDIQKNVKNVEREILALKREEKKLIDEIRIASKKGDQNSIKILAKSLVRLRQQITKLIGNNSHLKTVGTQLRTVAATHTMSSAMKGAAKTMETIGKVANPEEMSQTMHKFVQQNAKMSVSEEIMQDAMDSILDTENADEEAEEIMDQVLDEIGVDMSAEMPRAKVPPKYGLNTKKESNSDFDDETEDLIRRMGGLKD